MTMNRRTDTSITSPTTLIVLLTGAILVATDMWWPFAVAWLVTAMALLWCDRRDGAESGAEPTIERIEGAP